MNEFKLKGAYASINLDHIKHNYIEACKKVGNDVKVTCVVKSDAYGHGEEEVVKILVENGLSIICVSTMIEAIRLRKLFPTNLDILVLGYTPSFLLAKAYKYNIIQTISTYDEALVLNKVGRTKVHIKVNTGMNRLGFSIDEAKIIKDVSELENINICGVFSHLHSSDGLDKSSTEKQFKQYTNFIKELEILNVNVGTKHICNSGGIIEFEEFHMDMVREGIMLYGLYPSKNISRDQIKLKECMEFKSYIASIFIVKKGEGISYGHTFIADKDMKIATINLGYSDGVFRHLSNNGDIIIGDQRRPIVGRVCMNMFMVDITGMETVKVEDEVIIFGRSENQFISIDEIAEHAGTISYEVVCRTGYSIPRIYIKNNEIIKIEQNLIIENKGGEYVSTSFN